MSRMKRLLSVAGATVGTAALLAGCAGGGGAAEPNAPAMSDGDFDWSAVEPVELTVSSIFGPGNTASNLLEGWMDAVTEATEGTVTFDYYPLGALHPATEALSAMESGLTDVTFVSNGYFPDQLPVSNWDDTVVQSAVVDFGYPNTNIGGIGQQAVHYEADSAATVEMQENGFRPLLPMFSGPQALTCAEPFETPADLAGRQVRIANEVAQGEVEALGMVGVFLPSNEQYEALQRGVIDCAVNATTVVLSGSLLEVAPWMAYPSNAPTSGANWAISAPVFDGLAPQIQEAMLDARDAPLEQFARETLDQYRDTAPAAEAAGGGVIDAAPLNPLIADWWASQPDLADSAPAAVADPAASIAQTNAVAQAWREFSLDELGVPAGDSEHILDLLSQGSDVIEDWTAWREAVRSGLGS